MRYIRSLGLGALIACGGPEQGKVADDTDVGPIDTDPTDTDLADTDPASPIDTDGADTELPDDTDAPDDAVVTCGPVPAAASGVCDVSPGANGAVWLRGVVLAPHRVLEGGSVLIDANGQIVCVDCDCAAHPAAADAARVDCAAGVISPGLINAHDHVTFDQAGPVAPTGVAYDHRHDWRLGGDQIVAPSNTYGTDGIRWVELRQVMGGTTTMAGSGSADGMVRNADRQEGEGLTSVEYETFPLGDSDGRYHASCDWDFDLPTWELSHRPAWLGHIGVGVDAVAAEEFRCTSSGLDGAQDYVEPNTAFVHAIGLSAVDYDQMARSGVELVWSPRSDLVTYGHTADVATFATLGGRVAIGTDWAVTGSASALRELACVDTYNRTYLNGRFSDADLWRMATLHGAAAIGSPGVVGALVPGALGDVAVFNAAARAHHRAVLGATTTDVALVLRGGRALFGEVDSVASLGRTCDPVDVCGAARSVCATDELGIAYADLAAALADAYPAVLCGTPEGEPACLPVRAGAYTGVPAAGDADGDGVADAADRCPSVFDPPRPVDEGAQRDADGDGLGDACDPDPLPADIDGDGVPNPIDTCPIAANPDQADADADAEGDACDACPALPNPGGVCGGAPMEIPGVWEVADGDLVQVEGVVTGINEPGGGFGDFGGFAIVEPSVVDGVRAGVWVSTLASPGVTLGDRVRVEGRLRLERSGERVLSAPIVVVLAAGAAPAPRGLTPEAADAGDLDGALVTVDGPVTSTAYSCAVDDPGCTETGLWEIGGAAGVLVDDRLYDGADWGDRVGAVPVTGILSTR